ncbi:hypothetical protein ACH4D5_34585 [Streptomyces sp. NPDC018029]|uniref:hypothetical protein n=1 Tax=Streptomyces sp. NPDC018029 TaxID=3365032 RepID=UPI003791A6AC
MSENVSATELTSQYTAQVRADLERNAKEQQRLSAEIASLQEQLAAHQRDHAVLVSIQQALGEEPAAPEPAAPQERAAVPAPRTKKKSPGSAAAGKRARVTTSAPQKAAAGKSAGKGAAKSSGKVTGKGAAKSSGKETGKTEAGKAEAAKPAKPAQPTLVELIRGHLAEQSEPRSAAEIATALGQAHPQRSVKTTVVRTTLEGLVAKSQAQRSKQGSSVFYTAAAAPVPAQAAAAPAGKQGEEQDGKKQGGAVQGEEQPAAAGA